MMRGNRDCAPTTGFLGWDKHFEEKLRTIERFWARGSEIGSVQDALPAR